MYNSLKRRTTSIDDKQMDELVKFQLQQQIIAVWEGRKRALMMKALLKKIQHSREPPAPDLYRGIHMPMSIVDDYKVGDRLPLRIPTSWTGDVETADRYAGHHYERNAHAKNAKQFPYRSQSAGVILVIPNAPVQGVKAFRYHDGWQDEHLINPGWLTIERIAVDRQNYIYTLICRYQEASPAELINAYNDVAKHGNDPEGLRPSFRWDHNKRQVIEERDRAAAHRYFTLRGAS